MEFTYQSTMQLPASYAVLSEDEMVYTVGGAFELNINRAGCRCNFTVNVGVNLRTYAGSGCHQQHHSPVSLTCGTMV